MAVQAALLTILVATATVVLANGDVPIPENEAQVNTWFNQNIRPFGERKGTLDPNLVKAEEGVKIIRVRKDGSEDFKKIADAIKTIPAWNTKRVIIDIGPGEYHEKVLIDYNQPYVSLVGSSPKDRPTITYGATAKQYGTVDSATVIVLAPYFVAANLIFKNSAPRPDPYKKDGQALAFRINGDKAAFFNSKFIGFQDTLCDDRGYHFFKDCYIEGTVDFIFGRGTSLYLNADLFVIGDKGLTVITAQGRGDRVSTGYSFVHSRIEGTGNSTTFLGRPWGDKTKVVYTYTYMSNVIQPGGWSDNSQTSKNFYYGEYKSVGPGSSKGKRAKFSKQLTFDQVKPFITLGYIKASTWLLPAPKPL
ncbi:putative pectinesterase 50 [Morus notabilis]|uniref:Pectinesterase n=1 Tax=Morus notabilis TaxID=981085 RepID=W9SQS4_9ROSA|nr:probable pectinesterase 50 [Morus notabilis]EXC21091.1 putative pectinesterase 50 [Morus notabilis]